jgi:hypothetical protein
MLTSISGTYENGQIVMDEIPPIHNKTKVVITFLEDIFTKPKVKKTNLQGTVLKYEDPFGSAIDEDDWAILK